MGMAGKNGRNGALPQNLLTVRRIVAFRHGVLAVQQVKMRQQNNRLLPGFLQLRFQIPALRQGDLPRIEALPGPVQADQAKFAKILGMVISPWYSTAVCLLPML